MPRGRDRRLAIGAVFAAGGAAAYGSTIVFGRSLATDGFGAATVLSFRFLVAAGLLFVLGGALRWRGPAPGERGKLFVLGLVYTVESTLFFMALERGTAAAVALLFYSYPAVVTLLELAVGTGRPTVAVVVALAASIAGSALVAAAGADVSITGAGVAFALLASAVFSLYLIAGDRAVPRSDAVAKATWTAFGCGAGQLARGLVDGSLQSPAGHLPELLANGVVTAAAFAGMFAALPLLGPSRTSVVMTLEAVFAIVFAAAFLGEELGVLQVVGGAAILTGAVLVAASPRSPAADDVVPAPAESP